MATNSSKKEVPQLTVTIVDGQAKVTVRNWDGVNNTTMHGIEMKIERAIHQWRVSQLTNDRRAA